MAEALRNQYTPSEVSPPGDTLRDLLDERGISQADLATRMGRPTKTISEIVNGKAAITPETALELELVLGVGADFWNSREKAFRAYLARLEQEKELAKAFAWCKKFPLRDMAKLGWIRREDDPASCVRQLLGFFGVASSEQWETTYSLQAVAFRRSSAFQVDTWALSAWLRQGVIEADKVDTAPYEKNRFIEALGVARSLTREPPAVFQQALTVCCALAGVVTVFVPELPRSRASGATRWLGTSKALVQLSLRYRTDDHLWFTFFHEAAHILLHGKRLIFIEDNGRDENHEEAQANRWAAEFLIPPADYQLLVDSDDFSLERITSFAISIGIAPGIVVGRLQHEGVIPHSFGNSLKRRFEWSKKHD
jgi:HTH-type transcriptional regulator / antitoxin HigA